MIETDQLNFVGQSNRSNLTKYRDNICGKKMIIFQRLKFYLNMMCIVPRNSLYPSNSLVVFAHHSVIFFLATFYFVPPACFFMFEAETSNEYSESSFFTFVSLFVLLMYAVLAIQKKQFQYIVGNLEMLVNSREFFFSRFIPNAQFFIKCSIRFPTLIRLSEDNVSAYLFGNLFKF